MTTTHADHDEFVTIIGADMASIAQEFRAQGLSDKQYSIVHRAGRHRFTHVNGARAESMFGGQPVIAATYRRRSGI